MERTEIAAECSDVENQLQNRENQDSDGAQLEVKGAKEVLETQQENGKSKVGLGQSQKEQDVCGDKEKLTKSELLQEASSADDREDKPDNNDIGIMETIRDEKLNPEEVILNEKDACADKEKLTESGLLQEASSSVNVVDEHDNSDIGSIETGTKDKKVISEEIIQKEPNVCGDKEKLTESGMLQEASSADNREDKLDEIDIGSMEATKDEKINPKEMTQKEQEPPISRPVPDPVRPTPDPVWPTPDPVWPTPDSVQLTPDPDQPTPAQYSISGHAERIITQQPTRSYHSTHFGIAVDPQSLRSNTEALDSLLDGQCCVCPCCGCDASDSCNPTCGDCNSECNCAPPPGCGDPAGCGQCSTNCGEGGPFPCFPQCGSGNGEADSSPPVLCLPLQCGQNDANNCCDPNCPGCCDQGGCECFICLERFCLSILDCFGCQNGCDAGCDGCFGDCNGCDCNGCDCNGCDCNGCDGDCNGCDGDCNGCDGDCDGDCDIGDCDFGDCDCSD